MKEKLAVLADFCELTGREPDVIIRECLREGEDGQRIRLKVRQRYIDSIREFETKHSGGREAGNVIRSFFIHNGVAMSPHIAETYNTQGAS